MKIFNFRRFEEADVKSHQEAKKFIEQEKYDESECIVIFDKESIKFIFLDGSFYPIKKNINSPTTNIKYDDVQDIDDFRKMYFDLKRNIDMDEMFRLSCFGEDITMIKKIMKTKYSESHSFKENCERWGRRIGNSIIFEDSAERWRSKYGEREPLTNVKWTSIASERYIEPDEFYDYGVCNNIYAHDNKIHSNFDFQKASDLYAILDIAQNVIENGYYPRNPFSRFEIDVIQPDILEQMFMRANRLGKSYPIISCFIEKLKAKNITHIKDGYDFNDNIAPFL